MQNSIIVGKNLLETLTSALYENPVILFREYVQNSLDAYNFAIKEEQLEPLVDFCVDIDIDEQNKSITIKDNGYAILTKEAFVEDMLSLGNSRKTDPNQYIGFRGIGRISALPFCDTLTFRSKAKGSDKINVCQWKGNTYRKLINHDESSELTIYDVIKDVVDIWEEEDKDTASHYFSVHIQNYGMEVEDVLESDDFKEQLKKLLPIQYSEQFTASQKILDKYKSFMNEDLSEFICPVRLNGEDLKKNYTDENVLESDIIFWEIRGRELGKNKPGDKIGILWFTFNKKMVAAKNEDYGIMVRSKNVLMGSNDTFADLCASSKEHVATYSELTSTLRGVYGELLINYDKLKDNARREWFKTDEYSIYLKYIIVDFMRRLYNYRYRASQYYNLRSNEKIEKKKAELKKALVELVDIDNNKIDINSFCTTPGVSNAPKLEEENATSPYPLSEEDMPRESSTKKKIYQELISIVEQFFEKEKSYDLYLKLRAYIKNHFAK